MALGTAESTPEGPVLPAPFISPKVVSVTHLRIRLSKWKEVQATDENDYRAVVIQQSEIYSYRARGITIRITAHQARQVVANPFMYYFSTALKLHLIIDRLRKQPWWAEKAE